MLSRPESSSFDPKPNNSLKLRTENSNEGRHLPYTHRNTVFISCRDSCWPTRLHTPMPPRAMPMPTAPLDSEAMSDTLVCVLKLTALTNSVRGMMARALIIKTQPMTRITSSSSGSLKKAAILGAPT